MNDCGVAGGARSARCGRPVVGGLSFVPAGRVRCLSCAIRRRPLVRRTTLTALVVGTAPLATSHGPILLDGQFPGRLAWQVPLTYAVPFRVAVGGALGSSRRE